MKFCCNIPSQQQGNTSNTYLAFCVFNIFSLGNEHMTDGQKKMSTLKGVNGKAGKDHPMASEYKDMRNWVKNIFEKY